MFNLIKPVYADVNLKDAYGFGNIANLAEAFQKLYAPAFWVAGLAVTFYFLIGAFKYTTSGGDKTALDSARNMITHAIIGLVLLLMLFLVLKILPNVLGIKDTFTLIH